MRIILDIDDDVLTAAERLAADGRTNVGRVISDLARNELARICLLFRNGIPVLPKRDAVVTPEFVENLLDDIDLSGANVPGAFA
jgi:hypothetical protein